MTVIGKENFENQIKILDEFFEKKCLVYLQNEFYVNAEQIKKMEKIISESMGFWSKFGIGSKSDIQRAKKNVSYNDLPAFYAAVTKINLDNCNIFLLIQESFIEGFKKYATETIKTAKEELKNHQKRFLDAIKTELKKDYLIEDEIFDNIFNDFLEKHDIKLDNLNFLKKEFENFFYNREQIYTDSDKDELEKGIASKLEEKHMSSQEYVFEMDSFRMTGKIGFFGTIEINENNNIEYNVKDFKPYSEDFLKSRFAKILEEWTEDQDDESLIQAAKENWKKSFIDSKKNLIENLKNRGIGEENIPNFLNLIFYLFSQNSAISFLNFPIIRNLKKENSGDWMIIQAFTNRAAMNYEIQINDNKYIKIMITQKDKEKLFSYKGIDIKNGLPTDGKMNYKNLKAEYTFELDEKSFWKLKNGKTSFTLVNK